jgi:hypothetical protein
VNERAADTVACVQLANRFFHHLDRGEYEEICDLFVPDGVWARRGEDIVGRAALLKALNARDARLVTRHLVSNVVVALQGTDEASISLEILMFKNDVGKTATAGPSSLISSNDRAVRTAEGWKLRRKESRLTFQFA